MPSMLFVPANVAFAPVISLFSGIL